MGRSDRWQPSLFEVLAVLASPSRAWLSAPPAPAQEPSSAASSAAPAGDELIVDWQAPPRA